MRIDFKGEKNYALIGYPLGHSLSGLIHSELLKLNNVSGLYTLNEVASENLEKEYKETLIKLDGFNVTIPHKINIIPLLDGLSPRAALFGAVNTVDIKDGRAEGYNTDCSGFLRSLNMAGMELGGRVLICGSGGVSRMFAFESALADADLTIAVRRGSREKADRLRAEIKAKLGRESRAVYLDEVQGGYDLIINGTPVGMYPAVDACPLDKGVIQSSSAVFDAIYNPEETLFIKYAKEGGLQYTNGLPMLVWQAAVAEEIWLGVEFKEEDIKKVINICEEALRNG